MGALFFLINILVSSIPIISIAGNFISVILFSGYFVYCRNINSNTNLPRDFWAGFNYALNLILFQIILMLLIYPLLMISFSSLIPIETFFSLITGNQSILDFSNNLQEGMLDIGTNVILGILLVCGLSIYLSISFMFAPVLIVDSKLGFWQAMELSRKTVGKQFFNFLIFWTIFIIIIAIGTLLTFGIGLFFFTPFMYVITFEMYDHIFKPQEKGLEIDS
jgi:uncharacterized membrane protein